LERTDHAPGASDQLGHGRDRQAIEYLKVQNTVLTAPRDWAKTVAPMASQKRQFFGTDGVRAVANRHPMTPDFVMQLARGAAVVLGGAGGNHRPKAIIGLDTRASCEMLEAALVAGLNSVGVDAVLTGVLPTPGVAMLTAKHRADFGIVVSASHNPFTDNGIKFVHGSGHKLNDATELAIEQTMAKDRGDLPRPEGRGIGRVIRHTTALEEYVDHAVASMENVRLDGMSVTLDVANGAGYLASPMALERLGAKVHTFHAAPDGFNINEDCGCTHGEILEALMRSTQSDVGLAHDGDADRILLCDELCKSVDGDELMAIAANHMLRQGTLKEKTLVVTIMSNFGLDDLITSQGGQVIRTGVGDRYVLEVMREKGINLGGEQSGHIIFGDWATTGDGLIAGLQSLKIMQQTGKRLSELRQCLQAFPQAGRNLRVTSKPPIEQLVDAQKLIAETEAKLGAMGRVLLRYSGTESLIRLLIEGRDPDYLNSQADKIEAAILAQIG
jgi:phosphoglucosamine mutase